jgi:hypothetical protein
LLRAAAISLCLVAIVGIAAFVDQGADAQATGVESSWRLTNAGWERSDTWPQSTESVKMRRWAAGMPHPLLIALFESLAASFALLAFPTSGQINSGIRESSEHASGRDSHKSRSMAPLHRVS